MDMPELLTYLGLAVLFVAAVFSAFAMGKKIEKNVCSGDCNCPLCPVKMELKNRGAT